MLKVRQVTNVDRNITSQLAVVLKKMANTFGMKTEMISKLLGEQIAFKSSRSQSIKVSLSVLQNPRNAKKLEMQKTRTSIADSRLTQKSCLILVCMCLIYPHSDMACLFVRKRVQNSTLFDLCHITNCILIQLITT